MKTTVAVLFGGRSVENEISVVTALQTIEAMDRERYDIVPVYIAKTGRWYSAPELLVLDNYRDMATLLKPSREVYMKPVFGDFNLYRSHPGLLGSKVAAHLDVVLPTLHGTNCEDGTVQGVLACIGIPFVGCDVLSSANGMDKITMKMILQGSGVPVVPYQWFNDKQWYAAPEQVVRSVENALPYPVIVKPANSGSSVGIRPAHNREELVEAINYACTFTTRVIVERLVEKLKEVNCSVLGDYQECKPSVCEVPMRSGEILTYSDKYMSGGSSAKGGKLGGAKGGKLGGAKVEGAKFGGAKGVRSEGMQSTKRELPARISEAETELVHDLACKTFRVLGCSGVARIDFIKDEVDNRIYVNEINTIPGSLSNYLWDYDGLSFGALIDRLIELAFARSREASFKVTDFGGNIFTKL